MFIRSAIIALSLALLFMAGCKNDSRPAATTSGTDNLRQGAEKSQTVTDLEFLNLAFHEKRYGKEPERLPKDLRDAEPAIRVIDDRIFERLQRGDYVVHWGASLNAPVLAYEKAAPTKGGWVLRGGGRVQNIAAENLKPLLDRMQP